MGKHLRGGVGMPAAVFISAATVACEQNKLKSQA